MSFSACISHEGYLLFHERDPLDFELLKEVVGPATVSNLENMLQSTVPIQDPELLKRIQNSKKFHVETVKQSIASGIAHGIASGLTFGLSEKAYKKGYPVLKEKHLPPIREMLFQQIQQCGLTPETVVVVEDYQGDDHYDGTPDLVPEYQFWVIYIKPQNTYLDFDKVQYISQLRHQEKLERLTVEDAEISIRASSSAMQILSAAKKTREHHAKSLAIKEKRLLLEEEFEQMSFSSNATNVDPDGRMKTVENLRLQEERERQAAYTSSKDTLGITRISGKPKMKKAKETAKFHYRNALDLWEKRRLLEAEMHCQRDDLLRDVKDFIRQEKQERLEAMNAEVDMNGHYGFDGLIKMLEAKQAMPEHTEAADELRS